MCRNVPTKKQLEQENVGGKKSQNRIVFLFNEQTPWVVVSMVFYMSPLSLGKLSHVTNMNMF